MRKVATLMVIGIFLLCAGNAFAKQEFYGVVQAMPEKGYVGQWNVDGKTVYVTEGNKIEEKHGREANMP
jgi:DNA-binding transcriptional regulator of glucitol operon